MNSSKSASRKSASRKSNRSVRSVNNMDIFDVFKNIYENMKKACPNFDQKGWNIVTQFNSDSTFKHYKSSTSSNIGYLNLYGGIFGIDDARIVIPVVFSKEVPTIDPVKLLTENGFTGVDKESYTQFVIFCCAVSLFVSFVGKSKVMMSGSKSRKTRKMRGGQRAFGGMRKKLLLLFVCIMTVIHVAISDDMGDIRLGWAAACKKEYDIKDPVYQGYFAVDVNKWHGDVESCKMSREDLYFREQRTKNDLEKAKIESMSTSWIKYLEIGGPIFLLLISRMLDFNVMWAKLKNLMNLKEEAKKAIPQLESNIEKLQTLSDKEEESIEYLQRAAKKAESSEQKEAIQSEIKNKTKAIQKTESEIKRLEELKKATEKSQPKIEEQIEQVNDKIHENTKEVVEEVFTAVTNATNVALNARTKNTLAELTYFGNVQQNEYEFRKSQNAIRQTRILESRERGIKKFSGMAGAAVGAASLLVTRDPSTSAAVASAAYEGINAMSGIEKNAGLPPSIQKATSSVADAASRRVAEMTKQNELSGRLALENQLIERSAEKQKLAFDIKRSDTKNVGALEGLHTKMIDVELQIERLKAAQKHYPAGLPATNKQSFAFASLATTTSEKIAIQTETASVPKRRGARASARNNDSQVRSPSEETSAELSAENPAPGSTLHATGDTIDWEDGEEQEQETDAKTQRSQPRKRK